MATSDAYDKLRDDLLDFPPDDWEQREWDDARYTDNALTDSGDRGNE